MQATPTTATRLVSAPDADINTLIRYPCEGAGVIRLGAVCSAPGCTLTVRVVFWDALGALAAVGSAVTFTSDATPWNGVLYIATPEPDAWFPVGGPGAFSVHAVRITGGTWTLQAMAQ